MVCVPKNRWVELCNTGEVFEVITTPRTLPNFQLHRMDHAPHQVLIISRVAIGLRWKSSGYGYVDIYDAVYDYAIKQADADEMLPFELWTNRSRVSNLKCQTYGTHSMCKRQRIN